MVFGADASDCRLVAACLPAYVFAWMLICLHPACLRVDVILNYNANNDIVVHRQQRVLTTEFSIVFQAT